MSVSKKRNTKNRKRRRRRRRRGETSQVQKRLPLESSVFSVEAGEEKALGS